MYRRGVQTPIFSKKKEMISKVSLMGEGTADFNQIDMKHELGTKILMVKNICENQ